MIYHVVEGLMGRGNTMELSYSAPFFDSPSSSGSYNSGYGGSSSTGIPPLGDGGKYVFHALSFVLFFPLEETPFSKFVHDHILFPVPVLDIHPLDYIRTFRTTKASRHPLLMEFPSCSGPQA
jgi:hypothetical protein